MRKSINKTTVIIVLAIFLTLSVGYALFSDTITIEGTATAQGTFDIEGGCITVLPEELELYRGYEDAGFKNMTCNVSEDANTVSSSVEFEYPNAKKTYAYKFANEGTIKAELDVTTLEVFSQETINVYDLTTNDLKETLSVESIFFELGALIFQDSAGNYIDDGNESYFDYMNEDGSKVYLNPGETMYLLMLSQWPTDDEYSQDGVYYEAKQTATLNWKQSTN